MSLSPAPWQQIPWDDGFVRDAEGNILCLLDDMDDRTLVTAAPEMLELLRQAPENPKDWQSWIRKRDELIERLPSYDRPKKDRVHR